MGRFLFTGGGSGGHISPGLAIAERLVADAPRTETLFVCSTRRVDRTMLEDAGVAYEPIAATPFSLRPRGLARFGVGFPRAVAAARGLIRRARVDRVVAMGGFVSAPVVMAARTCRVPATLVNLDAPPGLANRWMAPLCEQVVTAIEVPRRRRFADRVVGVPIRRRAIASETPQACRARLGLERDRPTLLVTGASQGARSLNALLVRLVQERPAVFDGWQVCHLTGDADRDRVRAAYGAAGVRAEVRPFLESMGLAWGGADLALSRAGASSVAEAWANAVPTLFMPYPHHRDRHQIRNAEPLRRAGGAIVETDHDEAAANAAAAGRRLAALMADGPKRDAMRAALRARPAPDAAATIARMLLAR